MQVSDETLIEMGRTLGVPVDPDNIQQLEALKYDLVALTTAIDVRLQDLYFMNQPPQDFA